MEQLIRRREVERLTGKGRSQIYADMAEGNFPRPVKIGKRAVAWPVSLVDQWISSRIAASKRPGAE